MSKCFLWLKHKPPVLTRYNGYCCPRCGAPAIECEKAPIKEYKFATRSKYRKAYRW